MASLFKGVTVGSCYLTQCCSKKQNVHCISKRLKYVCVCACVSHSAVVMNEMLLDAKQNVE